MVAADVVAGVPKRNPKNNYRYIALAPLWLTALTLQTAINSEQKACTNVNFYIIRTKQLFFPPLCLYIINIQMRSLPRVSAGAMVVAVPASRRKTD